MRLRRAAKLPIFALSLAARTRHAWLARQTRARGNEPMHAVHWLASPRQGKSSQREGNALFDDFWYFSSLKSTIKEKLLYDSSRAKTLLKVREILLARDTKKRKSTRISFFVFTYCRGRYAPRGDSLSYRKRRHFSRPPARQYQPFFYSAPHKGHASA